MEYLWQRRFPSKTSFRFPVGSNRLAALSGGRLFLHMIAPLLGESVLDLAAARSRLRSFSRDVFPDAGAG